MIKFIFFAVIFISWLVLVIMLAIHNIVSRLDKMEETIKMILEEAEIENQRLQDRLTEVLKEYKNVGAKNGEEPTTIFQYKDGSTTSNLKIKIK